MSRRDWLDDDIDLDDALDEDEDGVTRDIFGRDVDDEYGEGTDLDDEDENGDDGDGEDGEGEDGYGDL